VEDLVSVLRTGVVVLALVALAGVLVLMVEDAGHGDDWPGWDEGWALVAFPLGIPVAIAAAIAMGGAAVRATTLRLVTLVTGAVWLWGAVVFVAWFVVGD
jgi:small-conductance mechanosensitive channel